MPEAKNTKELHEMLLRRVQLAMNVASQKMLTDTQKETRAFYTQGKPKIYIRTGALGESPKLTPISTNGNTVSFDIYLNQNLGYQTPNPAFTSVGFASYFSDLEVLQAAEKGRARILGKPGFWSRSEQTFQKTLDSAMSQFFN